MERCYDCIFFYVHPVYSNIGLCKLHNKIVDKDFYCDGFKKVNFEDLFNALKEMGWVYCSNCKKPLFDEEELKKHLSMNHHVTVRFLKDKVAKEESPGAF
jgi:thioredoxin-related protein